MNNAADLPLSNWQNFYVIVGSAAGALTGLQFVVITLIARTRAVGNVHEIRAFGSPTVVHFSTALLISALMAIPWETLVPLGICFGVCGAAGVLYSLTSIWHARKAAYNPDLEDWVWYAAVPLLAHLAIIATAVLLCWNTNWSLFTVAADALLFILLGIHNSWDTLTYITINETQDSSNAEVKDAETKNQD